MNHVSASRDSALSIRAPQIHRIAIERVYRGTTTGCWKRHKLPQQHRQQRPADPTRPCSLLAWHDPFIEPHPKVRRYLEVGKSGSRRRTMAQQSEWGRMGE
jgi:hypothetical protein